MPAPASLLFATGLSIQQAVTNAARHLRVRDELSVQSGRGNLKK
jgi:hypothetical protein